MLIAKKAAVRESFCLSFLVSVVVFVVDQALQHRYHVKQFLICDDFVKAKRVTKTRSSAGNHTKDHL